MALSRKARAHLESTSKRAKTEASAPKPAVPTTIQVGDALPDLDLTLQNEEVVNLATKYATKPVAVFAYPKASTPGCTKQTSGFGQLYPEFQKLGVAVFGLSADTPRAQTTFKEKTGVDFDLISDPKYELIAPLGAKKSPKGVIRSHWLFVNGKAVLVEHSVKPDDSPKAVLAAAKEHGADESTGDETQAGDETLIGDEAKPEQSAADTKKEESGATSSPIDGNEETDGAHTETADQASELRETSPDTQTEPETKLETESESAKDNKETEETPGTPETAETAETGETQETGEGVGTDPANDDKGLPADPQPENADGDETQVNT